MLKGSLAGSKTVKTIDNISNWKKPVIKALLPNTINFKTTDDLIRVGREYDGGYLVSTADVKASDCLIGLGINDDWSFEEHFKSLNNVEVLAYDASVGSQVFLRRVIKSILRPHRLRTLLRSIRTLIKYKSFFNTKGVHHIEKFVGFDSIDALPKNHNFTHLRDIMNSLDKKSVFLKIDVEGAEYRFLQTLLEQSERISGCVIEFHDCELHLDIIEWFVNNFDLALIHVHANNFAPVCAKSKLPLVLELTFSKNGARQIVPVLPNAADMPNNPHELEIELSLKG